MLPQLIARGCMCCVTTLGDACWKLAPDFHWNSSHAFFFFADFVLYHFAIRNHSWKCDYMLSPVSLPSESANGGGLLDSDPVVIAHVTLNVHFPAGYWCCSFLGLFAIYISSLWTVFHDFFILKLDCFCIVLFLIIEFGSSFYILLRSLLDLWFTLFSPHLEFFLTSSWHGKRFNFDKILVFHLWIMPLILCVKISHQIQGANGIFIYFLLKALQFYILYINILSILSYLFYSM